MCKTLRMNGQKLPVPLQNFSGMLLKKEKPAADH